MGSNYFGCQRALAALLATCRRFAADLPAFTPHNAHLNAEIWSFVRACRVATDTGSAVEISELIGIYWFFLAVFSADAVLHCSDKCHKL